MAIFKATSSTPGGDRHKRLLTFLYEIQFNSQQLLFEQFFDIIGTFGGVRPDSESTFPLFLMYNIAFIGVLE